MQCFFVFGLGIRLSNDPATDSCSERERNEMVPELRKFSRQEYLKKREVSKLEELKGMIEDEEYLFADTELTEQEKAGGMADSKDSLQAKIREALAEDSGPGLTEKVGKTVTMLLAAADYKKFVRLMRQHAKQQRQGGWAER